MASPILEKTNKAYRSRYGQADKLVTIADATGVGVADLYKAYRWGVDHAGDQLPKAVGMACAKSLAMTKAQKPPAGYTAIPKGKKGGYRKRVGGKWVHWYPRHKVKGGRARAVNVGVPGGEHQQSLPFDSMPDRVGVIHKDMSRWEVEDAIHQQPLEHLAAFVGDQQVHRDRGTTDSVPVSPSVVQAWSKHGEVEVTHNHPRAQPLSADDIYLAVGADLAAIRAVLPNGDVWSMERPAIGWGHPDGINGDDVEGMMFAAQKRAAIGASSEMDEIVRKAGGQSDDGEQAVGFDPQKWQEIYSNHWAKNLNQEFRSGENAPKLAWKMVRIKNGVADGKRDRVRRDNYAAGIPTTGATLGSLVREQLALFGAEEKRPTRTEHFWSGMSGASDIIAASESSLPIGVEVGQLSDKSVAALAEHYGDSGIPVFVDSGAYNAFTSGRDLTESDWKKKLDRYEEIGRALGDGALLVSPDKVGDQTETLRLMEKYAEKMHEMTGYGSSVLVPLQGGDIPIGEFARMAYDALGAEIGHGLYVPAFPMKAKALELAAATDFIRQYKPSRIHLLGLGAASRAKDPVTGKRVLTALLDAVEKHSPNTLVTMDSNIMRAKVGTTGGKNKGPRIGTQALADARGDILGESAPRVSVAGDVPYLSPGSYEAVANAIGAPKMAFSEGQLRAVAKKAGLKPAAQRAYIQDPSRQATEETDVHLSQLAHRVYYEKQTSQERRTRQVSTVAASMSKALDYSTPPPGYSPTPGSRVGSYRRRAAGKYDYWQPGQAALHARLGEQGVPKQGERGYKPSPEPVEGRLRTEIAHTALDAAINLLDDPDLWSMVDPDWAEQWGKIEQYDAIEQEEIVDMGEIGDLLSLPKGEAQARSDFAHEILEIAAAVREGAPAPSGIGDKYQHHGTVPRWAAEAVLSDRLTPNRKLRLELVSLDDAEAFIEKHHSALPYINKRGIMYSIGAIRGDRLVAVATAGSPTGRWDLSDRNIDPKNIVELTRVASDGTTLGASSKLVGRLIDILEESKRGDDTPSLFITYQLDTESGTTYRALREKGLRPVAFVRGKNPTGKRAGSGGDKALASRDKIRWEAGPAALPPLLGLVKGSLLLPMYKALTPPGRGWEFIPRGRKGGFRKRDGRGGWTHWYPEAKRGGKKGAQQSMFGADPVAPDAPGRDSRDSVTLLSMGLGRDSMTMLCLLKERGLEVEGEFLGGDDLDGIVFSDPGWEWPHSYALIPKVREMCKEMNVPFLHLKKPPREGDSGWEHYHSQREARIAARSATMLAFADAGHTLSSVAAMTPDEGQEILAPLVSAQTDLIDATQEQRAEQYRAAATRAVKRKKTETEEEHSERISSPMEQKHALRFDAKWVEEGRYLGTIEERAESGFYHRRAPIIEDYARLCKITLRASAACTANQKILPINDRLTNDLLLEKFGVGKVEWTQDIRAGEREKNRIIIGIAADEVHRLAGAEAAAQKDNHIRPVHPLVSMGVTKAREGAILERHGLNHTRKSGCMGCHFQPTSWYWALKETQPDAYAQIVAFERRAIDYAKDNGHTVKYLKGNKPLDYYTEKWRLENPTATIAAVLDKDYGRAPKKATVVIEDDGHGASAYAAISKPIMAKALSYWRWQSSDSLSKALKPGGSGWGPIPKGRRGGFRKRDGKGGWDYWYPETITEQKEKGGDREAFLEGYHAQSQTNPMNPKEQYWYMGKAEDGADCIVLTEIERWDGNIHISSLRTAPVGSCGGKGFATKVMNKIGAEADKHGVTLTLHPKAFGEKTVDTNALKEWYSEIGYNPPHYARLLNWTRQPNEQIEKRLSPTGRGWGPIPKGRRGGFRKRDGKGGWDYWYPETVTGQKELFADTPTPTATHRLETYKAELSAIISKATSQRTQAAWDNAAIKHGIPIAAHTLTEEHRRGIAADISGLDASSQVYALDRKERWDHTLEGLVLNIASDFGDDPAELEESDYHNFAIRTLATDDAYKKLAEAESSTAFFDVLRDLANEHSYLKKYNHVLVETLENIGKYQYEEPRPEDFMQIVKKNIEFKRSADAPVARLYLRMIGVLDDLIATGGYPIEDISLEQRDGWARSFGQHMQRKPLDFKKELDHWGSSEPKNKIARQTAILGDGGIMRRVSDMSVPVQVGESLPSPSMIDEDRIGGLARYIYAQEKMEEFSSATHPAVYRGMMLPGGVARTLKTGDRLPLTGCTAFSFDRSIAEGYATSSWTSQHSEVAAKSVVIELERTAAFDESVAGWHPKFRGSKDGAAYEIVSGANALEILSVTKEVTGILADPKNKALFTVSALATKETAWPMSLLGNVNDSRMFLPHGSTGPMGMVEVWPEDAGTSGGAAVGNYWKLYGPEKVYKEPRLALQREVELYRSGTWKTGTPQHGDIVRGTDLYDILAEHTSVLKIQARGVLDE